jgi:hypothetical protein
LTRSEGLPFASTGKPAVVDQNGQGFKAGMAWVSRLTSRGCMASVRVEITPAVRPA